MKRRVLRGVQRAELAFGDLEKGGSVFVPDRFQGWDGATDYYDEDLRAVPMSGCQCSSSKSDGESRDDIPCPSR